MVLSVILMDLFKEYLNKKDESSWVRRALTDKSYKRCNPTLKDTEVNKDLSTYGDAVIKLCYSELMLDKEKNLTEEKAKFESDNFFVNKVARHYEILEYLNYDKDDSKILKDYDYTTTGKTSGNNKKKNPRKYIATAVEAMIGAIYKEINNLKPIIKLLESWRNF